MRLKQFFENVDLQYDIIWNTAPSDDSKFSQGAIKNLFVETFHMNLMKGHPFKHLVVTDATIPFVVLTYFLEDAVLDVWQNKGDVNFNIHNLRN